MAGEGAFPFVGVTAAANVMAGEGAFPSVGVTAAANKRKSNVKL